MAADRDKWRVNVAKMRSKARDKSWGDSNTRIKQKQKEVKADSGKTTSAVTSIYRYHLN